MSPLVQDLKFAMTAGKRVHLTIHGRRHQYRAVREVDEVNGRLSLWAPEHMGDDFTYETMPLVIITSVTVTDVDA